MTPRTYSVPPRESRIPVAILWATGMVGRRFADLLANHPYFEVVQVAASPNSQGKVYGELLASRGFESPESIKNLILGTKDDISPVTVKLVFSAFEGTKHEIQATETELANKGLFVVSNNSAHRWTPEVPMMLPEVNPDHLALLETQESYIQHKGAIVVKPNCSIQSFTPVLKAWENFGIKQVTVVTEQAISGAGKTFAEWPEMVDNVIPYIGGEEEKTQSEPLKILGKNTGNHIELSTLPIVALCTRVAASDGHMANVIVELSQDISIEDLKNALETFQNPVASYQLPSSPESFLIYTAEENRPQTRLDRDTGTGMSVTVGRLQKKSPTLISFSALSHNTLRGAAGGAVLSAELLVAKWYL